MILAEAPVAVSGTQFDVLHQETTGNKWTLQKRFTSSSRVVKFLHATSATNHG